MVSSGMVLYPALVLASTFLAAQPGKLPAKVAAVWTGEPEAEQAFMSARSIDIKAGRLPEHAAFLKRVSESKYSEVRIWALARMVEAGDLARYLDLAKELGEHIRKTVMADEGQGVAPFKWSNSGRAPDIHPSSPFYAALEQSIREDPDRTVADGLYVVWCYNTLPNQRPLIYEIARHVQAPVSLRNPVADPWNDPRFWIVTDWALAWGEPEDFEKLPQVMGSERARREFERIATAVTRIPGFFACHNGTPLFDRVNPSFPSGPGPVEATGPDTKPEPPWFQQVKVSYQPPAPRYPVEARTRRLMANLEIQILLDTQGKVCGARAAPGPFLAFFAPTGLEYASRWIFQPAVLNGAPVQARYMLHMPFRLR